MDITEREQAEEALRESQERFRHAFDGAAIGMALVGVDGRFLKVNRSLLEMLGCSEQELLATNFQAITHPDDLDVGLNYMQQMLAGEIDSCQFEKRYVHRLGRDVWAQLNFSLLRDPDGSPLYFVCQIQDITERKHAEEALRESEERFRRLSEAAIEGILIHDSGRILDANEQYAKMLGWDVAQVVGMHVLDFTAPESRDLVAQNINSQHEEPYEHLALRRDGSTFQVEACGKSIRYQGRPARVTAIRDISERKRMEEALQTAKELLEGKVERQMLRRNPYGLTFRELTVLHLLGAGKSDKEIGLELLISPLTAHKHVSNILAKMRVASRTEAVARALREGLLD